MTDLIRYSWLNVTLFLDQICIHSGADLSPTLPQVSLPHEAL
jgi:hypothetical protein